MKNNLALTIVLSCLSAIDSEAKLALARSPLTIVPSEIMLRTRKSSPIPPVTLTAVSIPHSAKLNKAETADKRVPIKKYFNASPPFLFYIRLQNSFVSTIIKLTCQKLILVVEALKNRGEKCPICGNDNNCCCSLDKKLGICWCSQESFPKGIFDKVPREHLYQTCICKDCLDKFKQSNY